jgi:hypothetical protein
MESGGGGGWGGGIWCLSCSTVYIVVERLLFDIERSLGKASVASALYFRNIPLSTLLNSISDRKGLRAGHEREGPRETFRKKSHGHG